MTSQAVVVEFRPGDADRVLSHMRAAVDRRRGWVNLQPVPAHEEDAATTTSIFSGPSPPKLPLCTWKIEERRGRLEQTIGIQHGIGARLVPHLSEARLVAPADFKILQDHRRRGLVVLVPDDAPLEDVLKWLLQVGDALAVVETTGSWAAELYDG